MQESYGEGLATRTGPESCAAVREAVTGEWVGRVISRERPLLRAPRPSRPTSLARSETPGMA